MGQANCKGCTLLKEIVLSNDKERIRIRKILGKNERNSFQTDLSTTGSYNGKNSWKNEKKNSFQRDLSVQSIDSSDSDNSLSIAFDRFKLERGGSSFMSIPEENTIICYDRRYSFSSHLYKAESQSIVEVDTKRRYLEWASEFRRSDPRYRIMKYFEDAATLGIERMTSGEVKDVGHCELVSPVLKWIKKSSCFTVWRPTSKDAIRKMMLGEGVGKGLDIKGKSAKEGYLSGYIPFLQIYKEAHKKKIRTLPKKTAMRVFFQCKEGRDIAYKEAIKVRKDMQGEYFKAQITLKNKDATQEVKLEAMEKFMWEMIDPKIIIKDEYAESKGIYGLELPERLFWEAFVMRQSIDRPENSAFATGRPSLPPFQDMNFTSVRLDPTSSAEKIEYEDDDVPPQPVVYQYFEDNPLDPRGFILAYEENSSVRPVVSDFDCFLVGTRAVSYNNPISKYQASLLHTMLKRIEKILSEGLSGISWMEKWLNILCEDPLPSYEMPRYGFGDPKTYSLMRKAVSRLAPIDGCVRHGAECFNYCYPQELDDKFLVIDENLKCNAGTSKVWAYVDVRGLQRILLQKINDGYTFPLHPKWILCDDSGWKKVYDALLQSTAPHVQSSLNCWYPGTTRNTIQRIREQYPDGFLYYSRPRRRESLLRSSGCSNVLRNAFGDKDINDSTAVMDLAMQELRKRATLQSGKQKMKAAVRAIAFTRRINILLKENGRKSVEGKEGIVEDNKEKTTNESKIRERREK